MFGSSLNPSQGGAQGAGNVGFGAPGAGNSIGGNNTTGFGFGSSNEKTGGSGLFGSGSSNAAKDNTQGGLFGNSGSTGAGGSTGLFGKPFGGESNGPGSTTGGGLFGLNSGGTSFGQTGNQGSSGGLFGNSNTGGGSTGGLFGGANTGNAAGSGGLFGNTGPNKSNSVSGGLFGKTDTNTTGNSGGLFGGGLNNANTGNSGGLFGSNNSANTGGSGGLFGTGGGATSTNTSGGLFGSGASSNNAGATGGGLFGGSGPSNTNAGTTGSGLFGGSGNNTNTGAPGGGLFGGSNAANTGASGGFFGSGSTGDRPASNLFSLANTNSNFLNQPQQMGQNVQAPFATSNLVKRADNGASQSSYTPAIHDQLLKIKEQWDPQSAKCLLKTHFYNKLNDLEISNTLDQSRPANETPEDWDHAMSNRPGPQYYPIKVTSFTDVAQRIEVQLDHVARSRILLNNINEKQSSLSSKHDLDSTARILKAKAKHLKLLRRLLRLATVLAILKLKGYPLLPEEEEISKQFEVLLEKLNDPGSSIGKLNDVFARLAILKERSQELNLQIDSSANWANGDNDIEDSRSEVTSLDKGQYNETISKLSNMLFKQQIGLNHLNSILEADMEKVQNLKT